MSAEQGPDVGFPTRNEVLIYVDDFGVLVDGPTDLAGRVIDDLLSRSGSAAQRSTRLPLADGAAVGTSAAAVAATSGEYLRLTAESLDKVKLFGEQFDSTGALRGYVRDGGRFAGQLSFEPVSLAAEQALALQTTAVSLALRSAIADVRRAVEAVEHKVDSINRHLESRQVGDVIGTYRELQRVVDATNGRGYLLDADWQSIAGVRNQLYRDLEALREQVKRRVTAITLNDPVPKRADKFKQCHVRDGDVRDMLQLILVTKQSMHLYEYLRLQRIRQLESEHLESAISDARGSLSAQTRLDLELVETATRAVAKARRIEPLEIHRFASKKSLDTHARALHEDLTQFAETARIRLPEPLAQMEEPRPEDTRREIEKRTLETGRVVKETGTGVAKVGAKKVKRGTRAVAEPAREMARKVRRKD